MVTATIAKMGEGYILGQSLALYLHVALQIPMWFVTIWWVVYESLTGEALVSLIYFYLDFDIKEIRDIEDVFCILVDTKND